MVTTSASPPPPPLTVQVTVVSHNQTHHDWMTDYVSCALAGGSCPFLTALGSQLGLSSNWPSSNTVVVSQDATSVAAVVAPPPSPAPPLSPGGGLADAVAFQLTVAGAWSPTAQAALNAALATALGVDVSMVTTSASPPPAPLTVQVTVVSHNQTHHDWMTDYVSCALAGGSCPFLTALGSQLGLSSNWPSSNTVVVSQDATSVAAVVAPPPSPAPPLSPGGGLADAVAFQLTVAGAWSPTAQAALNAALATALGVDVSMVTTSASPPPAPLTVQVTVVSHNQTHHDWMTDYVSCALSGGSCPFLTSCGQPARPLFQLAIVQHCSRQPGRHLSCSCRSASAAIATVAIAAATAIADADGAASIPRGPCWIPLHAPAATVAVSITTTTTAIPTTAAITASSIAASAALTAAASAALTAAAIAASIASYSCGIPCESATSALAAAASLTTAASLTAATIAAPSIARNARPSVPSSSPPIRALNIGADNRDGPFFQPCMAQRLYDDDLD